MLRLWNKEDNINGVSASSYLEGNPLMAKGDVLLVTNETGVISQVLNVDILRGNLGLDNTLNSLEVGEAYLKSLEEQNTPSEPIDDTSTNSNIALALKSVEANFAVIKSLYDMREITKDDVFNYVKSRDITSNDYITIIGEQCPELPLDVVKQNKINEISNVCKATIYGGFKSTAYQGIEKVYGSSLEDQANITGNSQAAISKLAGIPGCENDKFYYHAQGEDFLEWTAEECNSLARDFKAFKEAQLLKSKMLQSYIDILVTVDEVNSVTWNTVIPTV